MHWVDSTRLPRHRGEEMVLELVLHAAPQPFGEEIRRDRVPCREHLPLDPIVLRLGQELLGLRMRETVIHDMVAVR